MQFDQKLGFGGEAPKKNFWGLGLNSSLIVGLKGGSQYPRGGLSPPGSSKGVGPTPPPPPFSPPLVWIPSAAQEYHYTITLQQCLESPLNLDFPELI